MKGVFRHLVFRKLMNSGKFSLLGICLLATLVGCTEQQKYPPVRRAGLWAWPVPRQEYQ